MTSLRAENGALAERTHLTIQNLTRTPAPT